MILLYSVITWRKKLNPTNRKIEINQYEIIQQEYIEEIDSTAIQLIHRKSGANIVILSNDNNNKVFDISFVTPPSNSTGIQHMLEHCVLCGSRKYALGSYEVVRDHLTNGTANATTSFLNTSFNFTADDDDNFFKAMDVYLDSVYNPRVLSDKYIFMREGWRFEIEEENGELFCVGVNGVVLNEMKPADGRYKRLCWDALYEKLMPNNIYSYNSGGLSFEVPNCSYEDLVQLHKRYYVPANSYIYLYGNLDINKVLEYLDREYLSVLNPGKKVELGKDTNPEICITGKAKIRTDKDASHVYMYSSLSEGKYSAKQALAFEIFSEEVEKVIEKNLAEIGIESYVSFIHSNTGEIQDKIECIIDTEAEGAGKDIVNVINHSLSGSFDGDEQFRAKMMAKINKYELRFWETTNHKEKSGLKLLEWLEDYWFYNIDDLFAVYRVSDNLQYLKNRMWGNCFNAIISESIVPKRREGIMECFPVVDNTYFDKLLRKTYTSKWEYLSSEEKDKLFEEQKLYYQWLEKSSIERKNYLEEEWNITTKKTDKKNIEYSTERSESGITYYHILEKQNRVAWMTFSFNLDEYKDHLSEIQLLISIWNTRGSVDFYGLDCDDAKDMLANSLNFDLVFNRDFLGKESKAHARLDISVSSLVENIPDAISLILNIVFGTFLCIPNFEEKICYKIDGFKDKIYDEISNFTYVTSGKYIDERLGLCDDANNFPYFYYLNAIKNSKKSFLENVYKNSFALINKIFHDDELIIFVNSSERGFSLLRRTMEKEGIESHKTEMKHAQIKEYETYYNGCHDYLTRREWKRWKRFYEKNVDNYEITNLQYDRPIYKKGNTAIIFPSNVNYISMYGYMGDLYNEYWEFAGVAQLSASIISQEYLREEIRYKGGAYGYEAKVYSSGYVYFSSYRDLQLEQTIEAFNGIGDFLRTFEITEEKLKKYKMTEINNIISNSKGSAWNKQEQLRSIVIKNMSEDYDSRLINQIVNCTIEDIRNVADLFDAAVNNCNICVAGSENIIASNQGFFDNIERGTME